MIRSRLAFLKPNYDGPVSWLWFVGTARLLVLVIVAAGTQAVHPGVGFSTFLIAIYLGAFVASVAYLVALRGDRTVPALLTWTQVLVDFGVVAATIGFTGGQSSFFTFLLVIVILEAGVLLGLLQGFVFASLATAFMFVQTLAPGMPVTDPLMHWYNFLIQGIAFYFTAFISGYWNQRVSRMKQFQRDILDNMNSGFLITDEKGIVIAINKSACRILELIEANVVGRHVEGILRPEADAECPVTTATRLGKDFTSYEFFVRTGDDASKLLGLTTNRILDARGRLSGLIASFTDLTEMARMRQELQKQDRLAVVGELAAGLAHEIRNPVASIRGALEELGRGMDQRAFVERLTKIAIRESDHLNEIVSGFLDFARNPSSKREIIDVRDLVAEAKAHLERKYDDKPSLSVQLDLPHYPCLAPCDPTQIRQVFLNIGQNAIEAMQGQGRLAITVQRGRGPIDVRFDDQGPGIAPDKVARIFEPFYTEKERGVGMGLAICLRIITAHDGTIQVASRPGGGTSMLVRLPSAG